VQHSLNEESPSAVALPPAELITRRQEPWPRLAASVTSSYPVQLRSVRRRGRRRRSRPKPFDISRSCGRRGSSPDSPGSPEEPRTPPSTSRSSSAKAATVVGDKLAPSHPPGPRQVRLLPRRRPPERPTYLEKALFLLETQDYDLVSTTIRSSATRSEIYHRNAFQGPRTARGHPVSTCAVSASALVASREVFSWIPESAANTFYETAPLAALRPASGGEDRPLVDSPCFLLPCPLTHSPHRQKPELPDWTSAPGRWWPQPGRDRRRSLAPQRENRPSFSRMQDGFRQSRRRLPAATDEATILIDLAFLLVGGANAWLQSRSATHPAPPRGFRIVV